MKPTFLRASSTMRSLSSLACLRNDACLSLRSLCSCRCCCTQSSWNEHMIACVMLSLVALKSGTCTGGGHERGAGHLRPLALAWN